MEIEITKEELMRGLSLLQGVCGKRSVVPILAHLRMEALENEVTIMGADLEIWIREKIASKIVETGVTTIDSKKLYEVVKEFPDGETILIKTIAGGKVAIKCGKSTFNLFSMLVEDFPTLPAIKFVETYLSIPSKVLKDMIDKTVFAASDEVYRANISGVYMVKIDKGFRMVATDGRRLCSIDQELLVSTEIIQEGIFIPKKGVLEIRRAVAEWDNEVKVFFQDSYGFFDIGSTLVVVRLLAEKFIPYEIILFLPMFRSAKVSKSKLYGPLKRLSTLTDEKNEGIKAQFKTNCIEFSTTNQEFGEGSDEAEIEYDGEPFDLGFKVEHLIEILDSIDEDDLTMEFSAKGPVRIVKGCQICIIMPMSLKKIQKAGKVENG